jgi:hypothetical protein
VVVAVHSALSIEPGKLGCLESVSIDDDELEACARHPCFVLQRHKGVPGTLKTPWSPSSAYGRSSEAEAAAASGRLLAGIVKS